MDKLQNEKSELENKGQRKLTKDEILGYIKTVCPKIYGDDNDRITGLSEDELTENQNN